MVDDNTLLRLALEPVDGLFFRDARPFEASSRAASGLPTPQTLAGAVRTLLLERHGVSFDRLAEGIRQEGSFAKALVKVGSEAAAAIGKVRVRGPWLTLNGEVLVPAPASLRQEKIENQDRRVFRLDPLRASLPGWRPEVTGMLPLWRYGRETVEATSDFLKPSGLRRFLEGDTPKLGELVPRGKIYDFDDRTGIGVDPDSNTAKEGRIYAVRMLALRPEAGLYAELSGPEATLVPLKAEPVLMRLGGEGRHVIVFPDDQGADWPDVQPEPNQGRLVLLTTPAWFNGDWKPPSIEPVAAAVGSYQAVSGWDLAKGGPKPNRFMVPAGSVYFLPPDAQIPEDGLVDSEDAGMGWGCFLEGNWSYV